MTKTIYAERSKDIQLGYMGENNALDVVFDISDMIKYYGSGTCQLIHQRNGEDSGYPCELIQEGNTAIWRVKNTDVARFGRGRCELRYVVGNIIAKSEIFDTYVSDAITSSGEPPEPWSDWMDTLLSAAADIKATATPEFSIHENGHLFVSVGNENHDLGNIQGSQGSQGIKGVDGNDGFSPIVVTGTITGGHRVTITDTTGPHVFDVMDGSGAGDMLASTYDPQGKEQDIFQYADDAVAAIDVPTALAELTGDATHRTVTDAEKTTWSGKQNAIADLATIRSGAAAGATAVQPSAIADMAAKTWAEQQGYAKTSDIPTTLSDLTGDSTHRTVTDTEKGTWNGKAERPKIGDIRLLANNWTDSGSFFTQSVTVSGHDLSITNNSKVDILPTATLISQMVDDSCTAIFVKNENSVLTAYAIGNKVSGDWTVPVCVTEVNT